MSKVWFVFLLVVLSGSVMAQISPGELVSAHAHLEGISNCTKCHSLGDKVTNEKCLACHTELKARIDGNQGFHSSSFVKGKTCTSCHSDHHGKNFQIVRFDKDKFDHKLSGFPLIGAHAKKQCKDCHKAEFISSAKIRSKKFSYLGLSQSCQSCHPDYHQKTLPTDCQKCHGFDGFKPAVNFSHASARYRLDGQHQQVACEKCHPVSMNGNVKFQKFRGIAFASCSDCHADPHKGQFGTDCAHCHSNVSFHSVKGIDNFNHDKTGFRLENKHKNVACKSCHKKGLTDPLKHARCTDCHADYHEGQLSRNGTSPDCSDCHTTMGFAGASYSIEQHNTGRFRLEYAHLATPCFACHKKQPKWSFRNIGLRCADCHEDIHSAFLEKKYYPDKNCDACHKPTSWSEIAFDHSRTGFLLDGSHATKSCRVCHFVRDSSGVMVQRFSGLTPGCSNCHKDNHYKQFETAGTTDCLRCHTTALWKIAAFDHNRTNFRLDGKHQNVACSKCHKKVQNGNLTYVLYKIKETKCEDCH